MRIITAMIAIALSAMVYFSAYAAGQVNSAWDKSYDSATGKRFIPVELWTGADWDGSLKIKMAKANLTFGNRDNKHIRGPIPYIRPNTSQKIQVYERLNDGKAQLFTVSARKDGLGRVYDSRYERACVDEVKFPLGWWQQGETRHFDISCNGGQMKRTVDVTIEHIDFEFQGIPHSLQYHWVVDGGRGQATDMRYVYSPGLGLVSVHGNE